MNFNINDIEEIEEVTELQIGELYDILENDFNIQKELNSNQDILKLPFELLTPSVNQDLELQYNKIEHIMKHKVNKQMYKITVNENEIILTEDHSCMVIRDNILQEMKPQDLKFGDIFVLFEDNSLKYIKDFSIEKYNCEYVDVYDLEVDKNHNFFGNNILVHNSGYFKLDNIVNKMLNSKDFNELTIEERTEFVKKIVKFINTHIQPLIDDAVNFVQTKFNAYKKGFMGAKVEKIGYSGIWVAKKRYAILTLWDEGKFMVEKPKLKVTGIETVKSSTPDFCIEKLGEGLNIIMSKTEKDLQNFIKKTKSEFFEEAERTPQRIGEVVRVNNLDYQKDEKGWYRINEDGKRIGAPMNSKAGIAYNQILSNSNVKEYYQPIEPGMKAYLIKLLKNNPYQTEVIAFLDDEFLKDLDMTKFIDKEGMWEKTFISPIETIAKVIGYSLEKKSDISDWF